MIVDKVLEYLSQNKSFQDNYLRYDIEKLAGFSFTRQFLEEQEDKPYTLRLSSCGKCPRQLAYGYWGYEPNGKEMDGRGRVVFFQGDMAELMTLSLARVAGCNIMATGFNQLTIKLPIKLPKPIEVDIDKDTVIKTDEIEITGHPDGILLDGELYLVECKSMPSYAFDEFEKGEINEDYIAQVNIYMHVLGIKKCVFLALNKNNGVMSERIIPYSEQVAKEAIDNLTKVLTSTKENLPESKYEADEKGNYPWNCLYCAYWGWCHTNAERVLVGKAYKLRERKPEKEETK